MSKKQVPGKFSARLWVLQRAHCPTAFPYDPADFLSKEDMENLAIFIREDAHEAILGRRVAEAHRHAREMVVAFKEELNQGKKIENCLAQLDDYFRVLAEEAARAQAAQKGSRQMDRREKIVNTFRKADRASLYLEAAEATGWMIADAQKRGLTKADGIFMAKQHFKAISEVFSDWAENHLERLCDGLRPHITAAPESEQRVNPPPPES